MSDYAVGPGWWQASDGNWYPPESHPDAAPPPPPPPQPQPPRAMAPPPTQVPPQTAPYAMSPPGPPQPQAASGGRMIWPWLVGAAVLVVLIVVIAAIALSGDDNASGSGSGNATTGNFCADYDAHWSQVMSAVIVTSADRGSDGELTASARQKTADAADLVDQLRREAPGSVKDNLGQLAAQLRHPSDSMMDASALAGIISGQNIMTC